MPIRAPIILIVLSCLAAAPAAAPTTVPVENIDALVTQLGHDDFKMREEASRKLAEVGKPALAALKQAMKNSDPEIQSRAQMLIQRIEQRPVPGGPVSRDEEVMARSLRISNQGGIKQIDVKEATRSISIREDDSGISMTVSAVVDGKNVSEIYTARTAAELKTQSPDAFTLYERWGAHPGQMNPLVRGAENVVMRGPIFIGGMQPGFQQVLPLDPIAELRDRVVNDMEKAKVADADRKEVAALLDQLQQAKQARMAGAGAGGKPMENLKEQFDLSDKLREKLEALKLPDPGDDLPPPARWRLGIQLLGVDEKIVVGSVAPDSRAEKIGIKVGDAIEKVNDKAVRDVEGLKAILSATKEPIVVEVLREGKELKLEEKKAP